MWTLEFLMDFEGLTHEQAERKLKIDAVELVLDDIHYIAPPLEFLTRMEFRVLMNPFTRGYYGA